MASPSDNPKASAEPYSPEKATSAEIEMAIEDVAPSPPLKNLAQKGKKKAKATKEKSQETEAENVASEAVSSSDDTEVGEEETSDAKVKATVEGKVQEEQHEEAEEVPEAEEIPEEEEVQEEEAQEEEEEEKGSDATMEKQSSSDMPVAKTCRV